MNCIRPLKAIRLKCYDCSGWNFAEVAKCAMRTVFCGHFALARNPRELYIKSYHPMHMPKSLRSVEMSNCGRGRREIKGTVVQFCWCGRPLVKYECPRYKQETLKEKRERIGKWSGPSKRYRGAYERF